MSLRLFTSIANRFRRPKEFDNKTVVVVGLANTGCDIAVELCGIAKKVYLSHRSGSRIVRVHSSFYAATALTRAASTAGSTD
jgi:cation diffusion facilitator CzcD-associated flavoprotein CzcO